MRIFACILILLISSIASTSQNRPSKSSYDDEKAPPATPTLSPQLREALAGLRDAALGDDYALRQVAYLCDNIGPRPAGSPQAQAAVEYVAAELKKLGLDVH